MSVVNPVEQLGRPGSQVTALLFLLEPLLFDLWFFAAPGEPPFAFFFDSWDVPAKILRVFSFRLLDSGDRNMSGTLLWPTGPHKGSMEAIINLWTSAIPDAMLDRIDRKSVV